MDGYLAFLLCSCVFRLIHSTNPGECREHAWLHVNREEVIQLLNEAHAVAGYSGQSSKEKGIYLKCKNIA